MPGYRIQDTLSHSDACACLRFQTTKLSRNKLPEAPKPEPISPFFQEHRESERPQTSKALKTAPNTPRNLFYFLNLSARPHSKTPFYSLKA